MENKRDNINSKYSVIVLGFMFGYVLEKVLELSYHGFEYGYSWLLGAERGEPGADGVLSVFRSSYVNDYVLCASILSYLMLGIWIGKKIHQHQANTIKMSPFLFVLAYLTAWIWSMFVTKSYGFCGTTRFIVESELFVLLFVIGFLVLLFVSKISHLLLSKYKLMNNSF